MIDQDESYVERLLACGIIRSDCLEMGAGLEGHNMRDRLGSRGIRWEGTDMNPAPGVVAVNLERDDAAAVLGRKFACVLLMNVLEHTFDPIRVLDNAIGATERGGHCVVVAPTVWPLHYFPLDCWRVNPGFFTEYAKRRSLVLLREHFLYVTPDLSQVIGDRPALPPPARGLRYWAGKAAHKALNTFGRSTHCAAYASVGAVFRV